MTKLMTTPTTTTPTRPMRKQQSDRLLKQLPLSERRRQQHIRELIARDLNFGASTVA